MDIGGIGLLAGRGPRSDSNGPETGGDNVRLKGLWDSGGLPWRVTTPGRGAHRLLTASELVVGVQGSSGGASQENVDV